jgi:hypothetical protein
MATIGKSTNQNSANRATNDTISGTTLSSWSRQQKLAMIAGFAILGLLLAVSACSKQSPKPALVGVSSPGASRPASNSTTPATVAMPASTSLTPAKKTHRKRPANVTYSDENSGVSFLYPRKFALTSGEEEQSQVAVLSDVPMNFVQPGGVAVATVALPSASYSGTDFASAYFQVNVNRNVSEQECGHFAFVDTGNADEESVDAENVKIDSTNMEMTSSFVASATKQTDTQYYHNYEQGACYEYILGLNTAGFGAREGRKSAHVNRDQVFAQLEKILATVKINPVEREHPAEPALGGIDGGKE